MESPGQKEGMPPKVSKLLRKIRTAVTFNGSILQIHISKNVCHFAISLFRFVISWFRGLQTALFDKLNFCLVVLQQF